MRRISLSLKCYSSYIFGRNYFKFALRQYQSQRIKSRYQTSAHKVKLRSSERDYRGCFGTHWPLSPEVPLQSMQVIKEFSTKMDMSVLEYCSLNTVLNNSVRKCDPKMAHPQEEFQTRGHFNFVCRRLKLAHR